MPQKEVVGSVDGASEVGGGPMGGGVGVKGFRNGTGLSCARVGVRVGEGFRPRNDGREDMAARAAVPICWRSLGELAKD